MRIVIAPDSFKESLGALQVSLAIEAGLREVFPHAHYRKLPMADGGEGTVQALVDATGGRLREIVVTGPTGRRTAARYGLAADDTLAVIEMAAASGLEGVPPAERDPRSATSFGTGELIADALDAGARRFVIGLGGSATNDGGAGMLQALGARLLDADGRDIGHGGAALARLHRIDVGGLDARIAQCRIDVACDVTNPLLGPRGASAVFGPQKGATPAMVEELDRCLQRLADVLRRDLGQDVADVPGTGAAGGMGAALLAVLGARLRPGSEVVADALGLDAAVREADLVVTGEGRTDGQTIHGKAPIGVARVAARHGVPVIGLSGALAPDARAVHEHGIAALFSAVRSVCTVEEALRDAAANVQAAARNIAMALRLGQQLAQRAEAPTPAPPPATR
ncbi:glycerate kinase [Pseudorhodoferax sp. Leaf274]|uniref:glycerate kinase n=1 Tax=Pseudorhodoferax sp. Leaf274 TaxID=1736318 RepID=UPI000703904B|nr:glycerate kinase [Pseudorhodoferax sp. Leaf274]KQP47760.1 glycerate kinase [Pseudorhodoferax sp. Leaf274]